MNRKQLEKIRQKVQEIFGLLKQDIRGCETVKNALGILEKKVTSELQDVLWQEYEEIKKILTPG